MTYLVLAAIAAGFALIPLPLFPSWVVVAYMVVEYDLRLWLAIIVGALGTMVGRVGLVAISRVAGERMLGRWSRGNLEYLHGKLESAAGNLGVGVLLAASPPPAGVLFIVAGAFAGLEKIVADRIGKRGLGFGAEVKSKAEIDTQDHFAEVMPEDLIKFGLIPEFIGRLPVVASVTNLDKESLVQILSTPKNALVKQYTRLFEMDSVELEFTPEALDAIAEQAIHRGTGARGLRAIMEEVLLPVMYDIPSRDDVAKVVVTQETVQDNVLPTIVPRKTPRAERRDKSA